MVPLVGDRISCPVYEKREVNLFFMTLADLDRHLSYGAAGGGQDFMPGLREEGS
jgi:hypothetical protein